MNKPGWDLTKLDGVSPVDNRPFTAEAPPINKIHPFSKIAVTLEPVMHFGFPSRFKISNTFCNLVYFMTESSLSNH